MENKNMTAHNLINIIDKQKDKLPDGVYKELCDNISAINKEETKFVEIKGTLLIPYNNDDRLYIKDEPVCFVLEIVDKFDSIYTGLHCGKFTVKATENVINEMFRKGYSNHLYGLENNSILMILSIKYVN